MRATVKLRVVNRIADPHPARRTAGDRTSVHRKSNQRRDDLCAGALRKRVR